ncbi:wnt inhibitory factor 1-like [Plakobranchus ocellatus]|uniref:Wnt inhibitory factor 1-like n=1 Tax=Plakobranchus ocellatus TaxID=259542 RepID=A0AAV4DJM5_9GAST|nr:wnt inhibitory factor 1-like [Plakobranchus ocellatus]
MYRRKCDTSFHVLLWKLSNTGRQCCYGSYPTLAGSVAMEAIQHWQAVRIQTTSSCPQRRTHRSPSDCVNGDPLGHRPLCGVYTWCPLVNTSFSRALSHRSVNATDSQPFYTVGKINFGHQKSGEVSRKKERLSVNRSSAGNCPPPQVFGLIRLVQGSLHQHRRPAVLSSRLTRGLLLLTSVLFMFLWVSRLRTTVPWSFEFFRELGDAEEADERLTMAPLPPTALPTPSSSPSSQQLPQPDMPSSSRRSDNLDKHSQRHRICGSPSAMSVCLVVIISWALSTPPGSLVFARRHHKSSLNLWIGNRQVKTITGLNVSISIIESGQVVPIILDPQLSNQIIIPPEVDTVNLTWEAGPESVSRQWWCNSATAQIRSNSKYHMVSVTVLQIQSSSNLQPSALLKMKSRYQHVNPGHSQQVLVFLKTPPRLVATTIRLKPMWRNP